jgi:hypothetical protein
MITRRGVLEAGGALALTATGSVPAWSGGAGEPLLSPLLPGGTRAEAVLDALPGKKPLIKLTYRPPNYEAPLAYLRTAITPNDEFFVRYHLTDIPQVDATSWKLSLEGRQPQRGIRPRRVEKTARNRDHSSLSMRGQSPWTFSAPHRRRPMGPWRDRLRALGIWQPSTLSRHILKGVISCSTFRKTVLRDSKPVTARTGMPAFD